MSRYRLILCAWLGLWFPALGWAQSPPYPADLSLLTLFDTHDRVIDTLTLADLEALPGHQVRGPIPDNDYPESTWYGVSIRALLEHEHLLRPHSMVAAALNDYSETIPDADLTRYDPIIAYRRDGDFIPFGEYGPLIVMYPYGEHPELHTRTYYNRTVWQLSELHLK
ncbi:oxidoreductase [Salinicola rhizosphaerae]|uniref:Oxidoreductase n=1 Tax=Salinicola rhizosphaerae TaxID=1443141 RepID=A0ABQ3E4K4_9GAMM|nr:oxidoreductase [Salinicola rhizosphaerae]GHB19346.1 hypothetical protein GCM10009038_17520 [Salinicola rhizosphaerae]